jgi:hypothetical protein
MDSATAPVSDGGGFEEHQRGVQGCALPTLSHLLMESQARIDPSVRLRSRTTPLAQAVQRCWFRRVARNQRRLPHHRDLEKWGLLRRVNVWNVHPEFRRKQQVSIPCLSHPYLEAAVQHPARWSAPVVLWFRGGTQRVNEQISTERRLSSRHCSMTLSQR